MAAAAVLTAVGAEELAAAAVEKVVGFAVDVDVVAAVAVAVVVGHVATRVVASVFAAAVVVAAVRPVGVEIAAFAVLAL